MKHRYADRLSVPCPTCGASAKEPCVMMNALPTDAPRAMVRPHRDRRATVMTACRLCGTPVCDVRSRMFCTPCGHRRAARVCAKAIARGIPWTLDAVTANATTEADCAYCGGPGGGIDRIDSARGYDRGNVAPCCWTCNNMKSDMPLSAWLAHMRAVLDRME